MFNSYPAKICAASLYTNEYKHFYFSLPPNELRNICAELTNVNTPLQALVGRTFSWQALASASGAN